MRGVLTCVVLLVAGCGGTQQPPKSGNAFDEDLTIQAAPPTQPPPTRVNTNIPETTSPVILKPKNKPTPVVTKPPVEPTTKTTPAQEPTKPPVAPTPARVACLSDEHEFMGRCVRCPPLSEYAGNGKCRETMKVPRDCKDYVNPPPACR